MANRTTFSDLSSPPVPGGGPTGFAAEYAQRMKQLFDASALPLTAVGGTADALTASLDPVLDGSGLVDGMKFSLTFGAANTGGMTLAINGGSAVAILDRSGAALVAGAVSSGMRAFLEYIGGAFRILSEINATAAGGAGPYAITITASTTWNKPAGYDDDTMVKVQVWGAGGGGTGGTAAGGGGGGYVERWLRYADVPSSVVCTIGAGGAGVASGAAGAGGNTTFGSLVTAYGGEQASASSGGGGGGSIETGSSGLGGAIGGGAGGTGPGGDATTDWGGGGGGEAASGAGGRAAFGGGGGGSRLGAGGTSLFGGKGGNGSNTGANAQAGTAPGGGGGGSLSGTGGAGARGEIRIQILG